MRDVDNNDIAIFKTHGKLIVPNTGKSRGLTIEVSISEKDLKDGSPKIGDKIAKNPKNSSDQWLVAEKYYNENLEPTNNVCSSEKLAPKPEIPHTPYKQTEFDKLRDEAHGK